MSNILVVDEPVEKESTTFRKRSFAMQRLPRCNENHESDFTVDSLTEAVFSDYVSSSLSSGIDHSCAHTFPKSNIKLDTPGIVDSVSSVESVFPSDHTNDPSSSVDEPSSPIMDPSSPIVNPPPQLENPTSCVNPSSPKVSPSSSPEAGTKPDETQSDDVVLKELDVSKSNTSISLLPSTHSKSLDDLLKINPVQEGMDSPRLCVSQSDLDKGNDDSDDEDYVIPFLYNPDEDDYVIASLYPCTDQYLSVRSNSDVSGYVEVKDVMLTLSPNTTCDDDFRTRSNSDAYDYVKDFVPLLPISPRLSPSNICVNHDAHTKLNSNTNDYEEVKNFLQEGPPMPLSAACFEDDYPVKTDPDYEEVKDYILQEV